MNAFTVTVRRPDLPDLVYAGIGTDSCALIMAAQDDYGPCRVSVMRVKGA